MRILVVARAGLRQGSRSGISLFFATMLLMATALTGCGGDEPEPSQSAVKKRTDLSSTESGESKATSVPDSFLIASAAGASVAVYSEPKASKPKLTLANPTSDGAKRVLSVIERKDDWLHVRLPVRPNGSTGWIEASQVRLETTEYRVDVMLKAHEFTVKKADDTVLDGPISVGKADTPTPGGQYYVVSLLKPPNPDGDYGPYAFGLSGFSDELKEFGGGNGQLGIHGTNEPSLLGDDVSHGCIRMSNAKISKLATMIPLGTPVFVHA